MNECEDLLGHIEKKVGSPDAAPEQILALTAKLPSATVPAPRILSDDLHNRLGEIAEHHGGRVPLHGRLFAQWLHHAYPRECPFPHKSGTTNPMTLDAWVEQNGQGSSMASELEKKIHKNMA